MTHTVNGHYKDGVVTLDKPVEGLEEADVTVTLTPHPAQVLKPMTQEGWAFLTKILDEAKVETGIPDLAHEHDHYIHGTPKRGDDPDR